MKKVIMPLLLLAIVAASCQKVKDLLTFDFNISEEFTVPGFPVTVDTTFSITTPDIPTNSDKVFKDNGTSGDLIKDIKMKEVKLTVVSPSGQTMDFLKSIELHISASGQSMVKIAGKNPVPAGTGSTLVLETEDVLLDNYIKQEFIKLKIVVGADEPLPQDTKIKADLVMSVTADPI